MNSFTTEEIIAELKRRQKYIIIIPDTITSDIENVFTRSGLKTTQEEVSGIITEYIKFNKVYATILDDAYEYVDETCD